MYVFREIPTSTVDYNQKKRDWPGFRYALKKIGLGYQEVKRRLRAEKTPYENEEGQSRFCVKAHARFQEQQRNVPKLTSNESTSSTTAPKSKAKPEEKKTSRKEAERPVNEVKPINRDQRKRSPLETQRILLTEPKSAYPRTKEQER